MIRIMGIGKLFLTLYALVALLSSCNKQPVKSTNEVNNILHENPHKVIYTLKAYQIPEGKSFDYNDINTFIESSLEKPQRLIYQIKSDATWAFEGNRNEFVIKTEAQAPRTIYKLTIQYFNHQGQAMNNQFIENGQDKVHQHLFSITDAKGLIERREKHIHYRYLYADKEGNHFLGEKNPIGLEGFILFSRDFTDKEITIRLLHATPSKYNKSGLASPYYAQRNDISGFPDINVKVRFKTGV